VSQKKRAVELFALTSSTVIRVWKFLHCCMETGWTIYK